MDRKKVIRGTLLAAVCMAGMLYFHTSTAYAYFVEAISDGTNVRASASTDGDKVTALNAGDQAEVQGEETGSDGKVWYQITINNQTGYVRSDVVKEVEETPEEGAVAGEGDAVTGAQAATVKQNDTGVMQSASSTAERIATVNEGTAVTVTGTVSDSSGNTWYEVNFIDNGSNVTGFIPADAVNSGEAAEGSEDAALAEMYGDIPTEDEAAGGSGEYGLEYTADKEGVNCWYLNVYSTGKRYKVEQLLQVDEVSNSSLDALEKKVGQMKTGIIILAVLLVLALALAGFFGYKCHEMSDDDDDDDDDEDDDDDDDEDEDFREAAPVRRRRKAEEAPVRRSRAVSQEKERYPAKSAEQRRPASGTQRRPASGSTQRPSGTAGRQSAQRRPVQRTEAGTSGARRPADEAEGVRRSRQPQQTARRPQTAERKNSASRPSTRPDVEWKSKNFLAGDEDDPDFSFIDMNDDQNF